MTGKELKQAQLVVWERCKKLAEKYQTRSTAERWDAADAQEWDRLNTEYDDLGKQIEEVVKVEDEAAARSVRLAAMDAATKRPTREAAPYRMPLGGNGADDRPTTREINLAFTAWARRSAQCEVTRAQREAAERCDFDWSSGLSFDYALRSPDDYDVFRRECRHASGHKGLGYARERRIEQRDQTVGVPSAGGYLVFDEFVPRVEEAMLFVGGVRQVATVLRTDKGNPLHMPTSDDTANEGERLGEGALSTELNLTVGQMVLESQKYGSKFFDVSYELIEDGAINIMDLIARAVGHRISRVTEGDFTTGTGAGGVPRGIVTAATAGITTASATAFTHDEILQLIYSCPRAYRELPTGVGFMFHDTIMRDLRRIVDGIGRPLYNPAPSMGDYREPDRVEGYPVYVNNKMASSVATTNVTMLFGHLASYHIRDIGSVRLLSSNIINMKNDLTTFVAFSRHDGDLLDAGAGPVRKLTQV